MQFGSEGQYRRSKTCMLTSPRSHARVPHERNLALIIKMSISNWSPIHSLHDLRLHFWKPWPNRREYRASSPEFSSTGVDEKISRRHAMWPQEPKLSPIKAASIPNDCPKRILQNSYSNLLFTTSFWFINWASRSKFNPTFSAKNSPSRHAAWVLEPRCSSGEEMSMSNWSPIQILQVGRALLRFCCWFPR